MSEKLSSFRGKNHISAHACEEDVQLQRPFPSPATLDPVVRVRKLATDEMLITRPGSKEVASLARRGVRLTMLRQERRGAREKYERPTRRSLGAEDG